MSTHRPRKFTPAQLVARYHTTDRDYFAGMRLAVVREILDTLQGLSDTDVTIIAYRRTKRVP